MPVSNGSQMIVTGDELGAWLGVARRTITDYAVEGKVIKAGRGFDLRASVTAYCAHIREIAAGRSNGEDGLDLVAERARLAKEQADAQEMKNALMRGELLKRGDVDAAVAAAFARVRARLISVPAKLAPVVMTMDGTAEAQAAIRDAIYEALRELSETAVTDLCGDDGDVVEAVGATAGPDGEPVG